MLSNTQKEGLVSLSLWVLELAQRVRELEQMVETLTETLGKLEESLTPGSFQTATTEGR